MKEKMQNFMMKAQEKLDTTTDWYLEHYEGVSAITHLTLCGAVAVYFIVVSAVIVQGFIINKKA